MRTLTKADVEEYVYAHRYESANDNRYLSRCVDGRYSNSAATPLCAIAGADAGDLALLYATARSCGFGVDHKKAFFTLIKVIGGAENFSFHTDSHKTNKLNETNILGVNCGHLKQMRLDPKAYSLEEDDIKILNTQIADAKKKGAVEKVLSGEHHETAVLQITGNWGVQPQGMLMTDRGDVNTQVFVFHSSLINERHKKWAEMLVAEEAVTLDLGLDEEYLYQMISTTTEDHLMETARRLAKGLPIFQVKFESGGVFEVEFLGNV